MDKDDIRDSLAHWIRVELVRRKFTAKELNAMLEPKWGLSITSRQINNAKYSATLLLAVLDVLGVEYLDVQKILMNKEYVSH